MTVASRMIRAGAVAGAAATACEAAWSRAEIALLGGRRPVFDPSVMAGRLAARFLDRSLDGGSAKAAGMAMRAVYGPCWALAWTMLPGRGRLSTVRSVAVLGSTIWLTELLLMPRVGATPPVHTWPRGEIALDASNGLVFAVVTTLTLRVVAAWGDETNPPVGFPEPGRTPGIP